MKRIFAIIICSILALLLLLSVFSGVLLRPQATTASGTVKVVLSSTSASVAQGKTVVVKVRLELTNFSSSSTSSPTPTPTSTSSSSSSSSSTSTSTSSTSSSDGIYSFTNLPIEYNQSLFEYKSSAALGAQSEELTITNSTFSNKVYISFETLSNKPINASMDIATITFAAKPTANLEKGSFDVGEPYPTFIPYTQLPSSSLIIEVSDRLSSVAYLSSLSLQEANLKPAFKKDIYNYTAVVDFTTTRVTPTYIAEDSGATVSFSGNSNLKIGDNTVSVIVTAADGSVKTYKIVVTRTQTAASKNISDMVPNNDSITGSDLERAKLEGERTATDSFNVELERERNRNFLIQLFLAFVILCELFYIILIKYGTVLFKGKKNNLKK